MCLMGNLFPQCLANPRTLVWRLEFRGGDMSNRYNFAVYRSYVHQKARNISVYQETTSIPKVIEPGEANTKVLTFTATKISHSTFVRAGAAPKFRSHGSMSRMRWAIDGAEGNSIQLDGRKFSSNNDGAPMLCNLSQTPDKDWIAHGLHWHRWGFTPVLKIHILVIIKRTLQSALSLNFPGPEHTWGQRTAITLHFVNVPPTCRRFKCACWPWKCIERRPHFGCRNPIVMQRAFHMPVVHLSYAIHTPDHTPTTNDRLGVVFAALYTSGPPAKLQWIETPLLAEADGGTDLTSALETVERAESVMTSHWSPERTPVIIFLVGRMALSFHTVSFGQEATSSSLRRMVQIVLDVQTYALCNPLLQAADKVPSSYSVALDTVRQAETFLGIDLWIPPFTLTTIYTHLLEGDRVLLCLVDSQGKIMILLERLSHIDDTIRSLSYSKSKRMLAVYASARMQFHIFAFDEELKSLRGLGTPIDMLPSTLQMRVSSTGTILFIDSSTQARIFSLITWKPKCHAHILPQICFLVGQDRDGERTITAYYWSTFASTLEITVTFPDLPVDLDEAFLTSIVNRNNIHIIGPDLNTRSCQSVVLDITQKANSNPKKGGLWHHNVT
ncbi:hypothetical protein V8E53_014016 [Lactarius tabidus]